MNAESVKQMAISLIDEAVRAGARLRNACEVIGISDRTFRRWRRSDTLSDGRKGAARCCPHALSEAEKEQMIEVCNRPEFQSLPPSQIVPRLADKGVYLASESSFYRVLREYEQHHRRGHAQLPRNVAKPKALAASGPNRVWSWDITYLPTAVRGEFYRLYLIMDIYSRLIVGWEIHLHELAEHAADLVSKACLRQGIMRDQLVLHSDNGSPMKGATMLATLQKLGVMPSFSRPSVSDDNPYSESLFRTLKYTPAYPKKPFGHIDEARKWVQAFVTWYNTEHRHSGIQFVTPLQRHQGEDRAVLDERKSVYAAAKRENPVRWNGRETRNWKPTEIVWLNPDKEGDRSDQRIRLAA